MRKRILSALLTLVMLLSLVPAMGTTAAAASESHPKAANGLKEGGEMCLFWGNGSSIVQYILKGYSASGSSAEEKWSTFKTAYPLNSSQTVNSADGKKKEVKGLAYYDPASGTLYLLGQIGSDCDFEATTDCSDVLTVIVDGDTTLRRGWCGKDHKGLGEMNIKFCNNATLNIPEPGKDMYLYPKAAALDITWTKETSRSDHDPDVKQYGDLELRGTGKLNIVSPYVSEWSYSDMRYGIQARNITIKDNVSLNIVRQRGTSFSSGILCQSLNIDTTGTVNIDVSNPRDGDENVTALRSIATQTSAENYGFNLMNAQSVTLKTQKNAWVLGNGKLTSKDATGIFNSMCKDLENNKGWTVTESADDVKPHTVTMTRAGLSDAVLKVGSQEILRTGAVTEGELQANGEKQSLSVQVKEPAWLKTLYDANRVDYNCTAAVYENGTKFSEDFALSWGGGTSTLWLTLRDEFKPTAGKSYIVSFSITPKVKATGEKLTDYAINGNWLLTAVAKQKTFLNAVELEQDGKITTASSSPNVSVAADDPYEITNKGSWVETAFGSGLYRCTVTLKVKSGSDCDGFMGGAKVTVTGGGDVTATNGSVTGTGDTMTTTLTAYKYYSVKFGDNEASLVRAGDGVAAPAYTDAVETGKEFKGWKTGDTVYAPGDMIPVNSDMTFTAEIENVPTPPEKVYQFSLGVGEENKPRVQFAQEEDYNSTGTNTDLTVTVTDTSTNGAKLTGLTAKFSDTKFKGNNKWFELYNGEWSSDFKEEAALTHELSSLTFDESGKATFGVHLSRMKKTETDPNSNKTMPVGHCYAIIELTATYEGGGEVKGNLIVELTVNERTEYRLKFTPKHESDDAYSFMDDTYVVLNGENVVSNYDGTADRGDVVTIKAVPADGLEFVEWQETNIAPEDAKVQFTDANSAETSFIMPKYNVELTAVYKASTHTHNYGEWKELDELYDYRICTNTTGTCDKPTELKFHDWGSWTKVDDNTHKGTCSRCNNELELPHSWVLNNRTDATFDHDGVNVYKCLSFCNATKSETIDKLKKIDMAAVTVTAPVRGAAPAWAETTDTTYYVADTEWTPEVSSSFAGGTVYTVKVELKATDSNRFTDKTVFTINGQPATVVPGTEPTAAGTEYVILTYKFPATGTGSSSSGSGSGSTTYTVKVLSSKNGSVTADRKTASAGTTVTLTVSPDKGYTLETLTVLDKSGKEIKFTEKNGKYTFTMPASNVEVEATFKAVKSSNPFVDVPSGAYYEDAVIWAVKEGVTGGTTAATFDPDGICTRAQAVTFLWRAADSPAPKSSAMPFTDVVAGSYYEQAVLWAVENGITKGTSDTTFSPSATCSRAQIVTFLWRSQKSPAAGEANPFTDVKSDAYYANAVLWAVKESVTKGTTDTTFAPNADCTRAQIVTFIYRALAE